MPTAHSTYTVYYYDAGAIGHGMAGRIIDSGVSPPASAITVEANMRMDLNGDPKAEGFIDGNNALRIAVTDYEKGSQRPVYIHNAVSGSTEASVSWSESNLYSLVKCGDFLYALDYDNAKVIEINATSYAETGRSYTLASSLNPDSNIFQSLGQELIVVNGTLYGLFAFANADWTNYGPSLLVRFTITFGTGGGISVDAKNDVNRKLAKNAFAVATDGTSIYVASLGGPQHAGQYNADSRLQSLPLSFAPSVLSNTDIDKKQTL